MRRLVEMETFVAVARAGSITRAAQRLGVAKSVVSGRLSELEARLGVALVLRTTRSMSLTEAGRTLLERSEAILDEIDAAVAEVSGGQGRLEGRLRVAAPLSFGLAVLGPVVCRFAAEHPAVALEVDLADREVDLVEEGFDLALRIGRLADSSLVARRIAPVRRAVAAAPAFWAEHGAPRWPDDLAALPWVAHARAGRPAPIRWHAPDGTEGALTPPVRLATSSGDLMAEAAVTGLGFVVAPRFLLAEALAGGALAEVLGDHEWSDIALHAVHPPTRRPTARARAFADAVARHVRDEAADRL